MTQERDVVRQRTVYSRQKELVQKTLTTYIEIPARVSGHPLKRSSDAA